MKNSMIFYEEWFDAVSGLPVEQRCMAYEAIMDYAFKGTLPEDPLIDAITALWRKKVDRDKEYYTSMCERNRKNGKRGGRPKKVDNLRQNVEVESQPAPKSSEKPQSAETPESDVEYDDYEVVGDSAGASFMGTSGGDEPFDEDKLISFFNSEMDKANAAIPRARHISGSRKKMLRARIREYGKDAVDKVIRKAAASSFLNGGGGKGFVANFSWLMHPDNFLKTLEGTYDDAGDNLYDSFCQSIFGPSYVTSDSRRNRYRQNHGATQEEIQNLVLQQLSNPYYDGPDVSADY